MATLETRIRDLATAVATKFNGIKGALMPVGGSAGQVLTKASGTDYDAGWVTPGTCIVDTFTANGTWTKRAGLKAVRVIPIGGGAGGGAGRKGAAGTARSGGGGGAGGGLSDALIPEALLGSTETVTIGAGGAGAAAQTTNSTDGATGTGGGTTSFGAHVFARGAPVVT